MNRSSNHDMVKTNGQSPSLRIAQMIRDDTYGQLRHAQNLLTVPDVTNVFVAGPGAGKALAGADLVASDLPRRPSLATLNEARRTARELRRLRVDAVHSHSIATLPSAMFVARSLHVPLIHSPHALPVAGISGNRIEVRVATELVRFAAFRRASFVAVSEGEFRILERLTGPGRSALVRNPVPVRYLAALPERRDTHTVLALSRFWPQKAPRLLLEAFAKVAAADPRVRLIWAGDGPDFEAVRHRASLLGMAGRISFLGKVADPLRLLREATALLTSSSFEAMPYAVLEAMAAGAVVVGTDIPAHREVDAGRGALVLAEPQTDALAEALAGVLAHPELAGRHRLAARRLVEERHSPAAFATAMRETYFHMLDRAVPGTDAGESMEDAA